MMTVEHPGPVAPGERIEALDVLRGFALLGILLLNIIGFGLPFVSYLNPAADGATQGVNFGVYVTVDVFFEGALRALFSMLFGAGVCLFAAGRGAGPYYRRQLLLLLFGLFDAFVLLWTGDILVPYALAGLVLYFARNWRPRSLYIASGVVFTYLALLYALILVSLGVLAEQAGEIQARVAAGEAVTAAERGLLAQYVEMSFTVHPPPQELAREIASWRGTYAESFAANAAGLLGSTYPTNLPLVVFWDALAGMLLGMALFKSGVLQAQRSPRFYGVLAATGLTVGLAVNVVEVGLRAGTGFDTQWLPSFSSPLYDLGRIAMGLGYLGLVMLVCQRALWVAARRALSAVGRMALTNYLMQSLICLFVFHEIGLGWWSELERYQLYFVVAAVWAFQVAVSLWWMGRYRFGPMEWLWRALTYGRLPPNRPGAAR
ncbi:MAG: DUF418 domain-containing protein [Gammaproteobacteria bacterium]|nr:DUF418 domain-containing protein [Gammaproteobacteria bacterium]